MIAKLVPFPDLPFTGGSSNQDPPVRDYSANRIPWGSESDPNGGRFNEVRVVNVRVVERTRPPAKLHLTPDEWEDIANS